MPSAHCHDCGYSLEGLPVRSNGMPAPCPRCGSTRPSIEVECSDGMTLGDHMSALQARNGDAVGFTESERDGLSSAASLGPGGDLDDVLEGRSPQGEQDTLPACRVLVSKLNQGGADWDQPRRGTREPVDCEADNRRAVTSRLCVQVVRANVDPRLWSTLNRAGKVEETGIAITTLAEQIKAAIEAKGQKLPAVSRSGLVLALDATRLPASGFDVVVKEFRSTWGHWASSLGFDAVWLVGPLEELTWRLDG